MESGGVTVTPWAAHGLLGERYQDPTSAYQQTKEATAPKVRLKPNSEGLQFL